MKIRTVVFAILFCLSVVSCNREKDPPAIDDSAALSVTDEAEHESDKEIMYVCSLDGLRVRKTPSFDSEKVCLLSHLQPVAVLEKDDADFTIDYIIGNWYLIECDEITGWVFSGYLKNSLEAAKGIETIAGKYHYSSIAIQREENSNPREYIKRHENTYFTLTLEDNAANRYIFATNYPENSEVWKSRSVNIYKYSSGAFYEWLAERGGGSGFCAFYYRNNAIIMYIDNESTSATWEAYDALEEGEEIDRNLYPIQKEIFEMTFIKE